MKNKGTWTARFSDKTRCVVAGVLCLVLGAVVSTFFAYAAPAGAGRSTAEPRRLTALWGDQGNGTYVNPVLPGDFSDLDVIRVGAEFIAISSTMQYSPGMVVLHSRDLVNWTIVSHVVPDLTAMDPALNWDRMGREGRGVWAGSIRFHDGKYRVYFSTPDQGIFESTALNYVGPWTRVKRVLSAAGWDDPCPFWDDDGQAYLVATHFAPDAAGIPYTVHLFKMKADGSGLIEGSDRVIHHSEGSEANKLYEIGGLYYHYFSEVRPEGRVPMMERAASLAGPWEEKQLAHVHAATDKEPNQGGLIELSSERWYFLTHQGYGAWEGRAGVLLPVSWRDGWPMLGTLGRDGIGNMAWSGAIPVPGQRHTSPAASDDFSGSTLKPAWEWRYQPRAEAWSLAERPGFLRLYAFASLPGKGFAGVGNVLTQRAYRTRRSEVSVKLEVSGMVDGQVAGLAHFGGGHAAVEVVQKRGLRWMSFDDGGREQRGPRLHGVTVYLRSIWDLKGTCTFAFSEDGKKYVRIGRRYQASWASYRGDRLGVYTSSTGGVEGFIDLDSFRYTLAR